MSHKVLLPAFCLIAVFTPLAIAQDPPETAETQRRAAKDAVPRVAPTLDTAALKAAGIDPDSLDAAHRQLYLQLSSEELSAILRGADPKTIRTANGKTVEELAREAGLGEIDEELVYTPVTPCRVIDTRWTAPWSFWAGEVRSYNLIGPANYSGYGGFAGSCGIPSTKISSGVNLWTNKVRALAVNVVAESPSGTGWMRAWPTNQAMPLASILNFTRGVMIANGITLRTCTASCSAVSPTCEPCPSGDLTFIVENAPANVFVDVVGYFVPANVSGLVGASSEGTRSSLQLMNSTCQQVASCSITNPGSSSRGVVAIGSANAEINHQYGYHDAIGATVSDASASCAFPWTSPYAGKFEVHEFHPTGCCMEGTISVTRRFTLAAGATATYYLNARTTYSESTPATSDYLQSATLQCILVQ